LPGRIARHQPGSAQRRGQLLARRYAPPRTGRLEQQILVATGRQASRLRAAVRGGGTARLADVGCGSGWGCVCAGARQRQRAGDAAARDTAGRVETAVRVVLFSERSGLTRARGAPPIGKWAGGRRTLARAAGSWRSSPPILTPRAAPPTMVLRGDVP